MQKSDRTTKKIIKSNSRGRCPDGAPNPIDVYVGQRIRMRRQFLGMSQERFAAGGCEPKSAKLYTTS